MKGKVAGNGEGRLLNYDQESAGWRQAVGPAEPSHGCCARRLTVLGGSLRVRKMGVFLDKGLTLTKMLSCKHFGATTLVLQAWFLWGHNMQSAAAGSQAGEDLACKAK